MTSLRRTLTVRLVLGLTAFLLASEGALFLFMRRQIVGSFDEGLLETARFLASAVHAEGNGHLDMELGDVPVPGFAAAAPTGYFEIWDGSTPLFRSASLGGRELARPTGAGGGSVFTDALLPDARPGRGVSLTFAPTPEPGVAASARNLTLVVARERETLDARLRGVTLALGALGLVLLLLMPIVVAGGVRKGLAPLVVLGRDVDAIDVGSLERRLPTQDLPVELVPVAERMNQLLDRLQEGVTRERRFSDDVAHQLRTPIAELRALADVALAGIDHVESPHRQSFEDARAIAVQMELLAVGLLALARGESTQPVAPAVVDLRALVRRVRSDLEPRAAGRHLRLSAYDEQVSPATINADPTLLESVLGSLFDNALAYTPPGGQITIAADSDGRFARLEVTNDDKTLAAEDLPRLFERFWRKNQAQRDGEHSGLGLPVALAMARAMGGGLTADRPVPDRLRFTLSLPVAVPGSGIA